MLTENRLILLIFCFISQSLIGQEFIYTNYNTQNGLPSSKIYHVLQDSKGYIWLATDNGVSRYNGYEFENFDMNDGLAENTISEIYEDQKGIIWFIGNSGKLAHFSNGNIEAYTFNENLTQILPENPIVLKSGFYIDSTQNIFISIIGLDLYQVSKNGDIKSYNETSLSRNTQTIYQIDKNRRVLALKSNPTSASSYDFNLLINKGENFEYITKLPQAPEKQLVYLFAHYVNDTSLWFSSGNVVYFIQNKTIKSKHKFEDDIVWMKSKSKDELWICTAKNVAQNFDIKNNLLTPKLHLLKGYTVTSTFQDNYGSYWFSTLNNGVFKLESDKLKVLNKNSGLLNDKVSSIELFNNTIWIGYTQNRITKINVNKTDHTTYSSLNSSSTNKLYYDKDERKLLIAATDYLYLIEKEQIKTIKKYNYLNSPRFIADLKATATVSDKNGGYWVASEIGFYHLKYNHIIFDSWKDKNFKIRVNTLKLDKNQTLWLGCRDGLRAFKGNKLICFRNKLPKLKSEILDIEIYNDLLILATKGNGILLFNGKSLTEITKNDGLISNMVTSLAIKDSTLWAGSLNGINRIDFATSEIYPKPIRVLSPPELSGFQVNQIKIHQTKLYLATNKGVIIRDINENIASEIAPPFYFKKLTINGQNIDLKDRYYLKRNQNNLGIHFEALDYNTRLPLQYKYQLKGLDTSWIVTTRRIVNYYYLDPGKYEFIAKVKNRNGEWVAPFISIKFTIAPAIWQTTTFMIGVILLFVTLLVLAYSIKLANAKKQMLIKRKIYSYKLQTLLGQMRPHFIFNTLNSINNYIISNEAKSASKYLSKFSSLIRKILEHSQYEQISLAEELEALELYLHIEAMRLRHKFAYTIDVGKDIDIFETKVPSLILQPFVENSIWHGIQPLDKKGVIKIKISKKGSTLAVDIIDNGIGREKAIKLSKGKSPDKKSLGTKITRERLELLAKKLNREAMIEYIDLYAKEESIGTKVKISLPIISERKEILHIETKD